MMEGLQRRKTVCTICSGYCGLVVDFENEKIVRVVGDKDHPVSKGYVCNKGIEALQMYSGEHRLKKSLKKQADGTFAQIDLETALDEIAEKMRECITESGGETVGFFTGTGGYTHTATNIVRTQFLKALKSPNYYTTTTIDQSCRLVTMGRMGSWQAGKQKFENSDIALIIGANPLVSLGAYTTISYNPAKRIKAAQARGTKIVVIDPRRTETAKQADFFLQPMPGEDPTILAGLIHIILKNEWHDKRFCKRWVNGVDALRHALEPFTPDVVAQRADIDPEDLHMVARMFAVEARTGHAVLGTGLSMSPRSNLAGHLIEAMNFLCGRVLKEGDEVPNPGVVSPPKVYKAQPRPPMRVWEKGPKMVTGHGALYGERPTGALADQILTDEPGKIKVMFLQNTNLAVSSPDQKRMVKALKSLELMVTIDTFMTPTCQLSDYVIAGDSFFEREGPVLSPGWDVFTLDVPFAQWVKPIWTLPKAYETTTMAYILWGLAKRLELDLRLPDDVLNEQAPPSESRLTQYGLQYSRVPQEDIQNSPNGWFMLDQPIYVEAADAGCDIRLELAPDDVLTELEKLVLELKAVPEDKLYKFRLINRRTKGVMNSLGIGWPTAREKRENNPAFLNPEDLKALGLCSGEEAIISGTNGNIKVTVEPDAGLRRGLISITHCWGHVPGEAKTQFGFGANTNVLTDSENDREDINAMPIMNCLPVNISSAS